MWLKARDTLCRIVDRLEEAGLVERRRDPADRRAWQLFLTTTAEPLVEKLHALAHVMSDEAFAGLDRKQLEAARAVLAQVRSNLASTQKTKMHA